MTGLKLSQAEHDRLARRYRLRRYGLAFIFLSPSFFFLIVVLLIPSLWVIYLSFHQGGIFNAARFVGLNNWIAIVGDPVAWQAARNTVVYALLVTPLSFVVSMGLAMMLKRIVVGKGIFRAVLYFPTLTPYVIAALIWTFVVHPDFGVLSVLLRLAGFDTVNWLGPDLALISVVMLEFWHGVGYWTLIFLAALVGLPDELYQAAKIDGARGVRLFWYVTLPLLRPVLTFALVMATIFNIRVFDPILVLTDGGPAYSTESIAVYLYKQTFTNFNPGGGAAMGVVMLAVVLVLTFAQLRLLRRRW